MFADGESSLLRLSANEYHCDHKAEHTYAPCDGSERIAGWMTRPDATAETTGIAPHKRANSRITVKIRRDWTRPTNKTLTISALVNAYLIVITLHSVSASSGPRCGCWGQR